MKDNFFINNFLSYKPNANNNNLVGYYYDYFVKKVEEESHLEADKFFIKFADVLSNLRKEDAVFNIICESYNYKLSEGFKPRLLDLLDYISNYTYNSFIKDYEFCMTLSKAVDQSTKGFYLSNHEIAELRSNFTK